MLTKDQKYLNFNYLFDKFFFNFFFLYININRNIIEQKAHIGYFCLFYIYYKL